ncbi:polysaccharide pyruvyl transferase family protein [Vibrio breoganii]
MKVCILTQPLHKNYGGLLQAYALQKVIRDNGHDAYTADIPFRKPRLLGIPSCVKACVNRYLRNKPVARLWPLSSKEKARIQKETDRFIAEKLTLTKRVESVSNIQQLDEYQFDAFVVGSDQVWRPLYSPGILTYFFDFLEGKQNVKRMSYAASFGVDNADEYSPEQIKHVSHLLSQFDEITVRESSAVDLCSNVFGASAKHVVDPTLLLDKETYISLVDQDNTPQSTGDLFVYVLDQREDKRKVIDFVLEQTQLDEFTVLPETAYETYPAVTQWIRGFMDAKYVVTDSFHGVAFCIIFNIPFVAIGNESRGLARFTSVLSKFGLLDRLVTSVDDISAELVAKEINFTAVNKIRNLEKQSANDILASVLNN